MFTAKQSDVFYNDETKEMFVCVVSSVTADKCDGADEILYGAVPLVYKIDKDTNYKSIAYPPNLSTFSTDDYSDLFAVTPTCPEGTNFNTITKPTINYNKDTDRYSVTFLGKYETESEGLAITNFVFQNVDTELYLIDTKTLIPNEKFNDSPYTFVDGSLNSNLVIGGNMIRNGKDSFFGEFERSPDPLLTPIHISRTKLHDTLSFNVSLQQTNTTIDSLTGNAIFPVMHTGGYIGYKSNYVGFDPEQNIRVDFRARAFNVPTMTAYGSNQNASLSATRWYSQYSPASSAAVSGGAGFCVYFYKNDCKGQGVPNGIGDSLGYAQAETQAVEVAGTYHPVDGIFIKNPQKPINVGIGMTSLTSGSRYGQYAPMLDSQTSLTVGVGTTMYQAAGLEYNPLDYGYPADSFLGVGFDITGNFCLKSDDMSGWYQHGGTSVGSHTQTPCSVGIRGSKFHNTQVLTCIPMTGVAAASAVPMHRMLDTFADITNDTKNPWVDYRVDLSNRGSKVTIYNKLTGDTDYNTIAEFRLNKPVHGNKKYNPWEGFDIEDDTLPVMNVGLTFTSSTYCSFFELKSFEAKGVKVNKPCAIKPPVTTSNYDEPTDYLEESSKNLREKLVNVKVDDDAVDVELVVPARKATAQRIKPTLADRATLCDEPQEEEILEEIEVKYTGIPPEEIVGVIDKVSRGDIPETVFTPNIKTTSKVFDTPEIIEPTEPVIWELPSEPCGGQLAAEGHRGWPCQFTNTDENGDSINLNHKTITLGTATGKVWLDYTAFTAVDRFVVYWNGKPVIDTYWVGGQGEKSELRSALKGKGYTNDQANIAANNIGNNGKAYFIKTERFPTTAELVVWGAYSGTRWNATLQCPNENDLDGTQPNTNNRLINIPSDFQNLVAVNENEKVLNVDGIDVTAVLIDRGDGMPFPVKEIETVGGGE